MQVDVLVIGAGINGLCTARALLSKGLRVGLVERFRIGHDRGSSHGTSRITRSTYEDPVFARLMQIAHKESWPDLEAEAGVKLIHRRDGCFFGQRGGEKWARYEASVASVGADVEALTPAEARQVFPAFRFDGDYGILRDRTGGVVAAADTIAALARLVRAKGEVWEDTEVLSVHAKGAETSRGPITADRVVVTAGPWASRLFPQLARALSPVRQTVTYLDVDGAADLPVWAYVGEQETDFYYGLPAFQRPGAKMARHITDGRRDDPDGTPGEPETGDPLAFARRHFVAPIRGILATERCFYTNTDDEDFVLDTLDGITVGAGFSGHGFKFGPLTGRILAELAIDGKTTLPEFEAARDRFRA